MKLEHTDIIDAPTKEIYCLVRDQLPEIAQYLPSVREIKTVERQKLTDNTHKVINHWFAKAELPSLVSKFISEDFLSWKDIATWSDDKMCVHYKLESFVANDLFTATGANFFKDVNGKTELTITCDVTIHPDKIPGVPRIMVRTVLPTIEKVLEKMLGPNLTSLGKGLRSYLADKGKN